MTITVSTFRAIQKLDSNRNGLTVDELRSTDTDRNGSLSADEAKAAGFAEADRATLNRRLQGKLPTGSAFVFTGDEMRALRARAVRVDRATLKRWLHIDARTLPSVERARMNEVLSKSAVLHTVYTMRQELAALWQRFFAA